MVKTVEGYMEQHQMIMENDVIVAGVSGGADSVCLFLLLEEFCKRKHAKLVVVHMNHGIRPEAAEDAAYVRQLCEEFGVPFHL
ncbi:MAG: tRNA(Ile)-lysidine synthetase, partial [Lachnospiraceae bacterium]|nr:tRNA(Ile)-lysidine synthetase [Lachnospiraceae bacterium]